MKNKLSKIFTSGVVLLSFPMVAFANIWDDIQGQLDGTDTSVDKLIVRILNWLIGAAAVVCVVMLVVGGYSYMTAGGDENKVKTATKTLTNAMIGLAICFIAVMLVNFVLETFLNGGEEPTSLLMTFLA
jgi:cytochrome bd-type quinol oxidase subunit 2